MLPCIVNQNLCDLAQLDCLGLLAVDMRMFKKLKLIGSDQNYSESNTTIIGYISIILPLFTLILTGSKLNLNLQGIYARILCL